MNVSTLVAFDLPQFNVSIDQHFQWKWIDKEKGVLEHENGDQYVTFTKDVEQKSVYKDKPHKRFVYETVQRQFLQKREQYDKENHTITVAIDYVTNPITGDVTLVNTCAK